MALDLPEELFQTLFDLPNGMCSRLSDLLKGLLLRFLKLEKSSIEDSWVFSIGRGKCS